MGQETMIWFDIWAAAVAADASERIFYFFSASGLRFHSHVWRGGQLFFGSRLFYHPMAFKQKEGLTSMSSVYQATQVWHVPKSW